MSITRILVAGSDGVGDVQWGETRAGYPKRPWITEKLVEFGNAHSCNEPPNETKQFVILKGSTMHECIWACRSTLAGDAPTGFQNRNWRPISVSKRSGAGAAHRQRQEAVNLATHAFILWDGRSRGTAQLIDMVEAKGIPFIVHMVG